MNTKNLLLVLFSSALLVLPFSQLSAHDHGGGGGGHMGGGGGHFHGGGGNWHGGGNHWHGGDWNRGGYGNYYGFGLGGYPGYYSYSSPSYYDDYYSDPYYDSYYGYGDGLNVGVGGLGFSVGW